MHITGLRSDSEATTHTSCIETASTATERDIFLHTREASSASTIPPHTPRRTKYILNCRSLTLHQKTRVLKLQILPDFRGRQRGNSISSTSRRESSDFIHSRNSVESNHKSQSHSPDTCNPINSSELTLQSGTPNSQISKRQASHTNCSESQVPLKSSSEHSEFLHKISCPLRNPSTPNLNKDQINPSVKASDSLKVSPDSSKISPESAKVSPDSVKASHDSSSVSKSFSGQYITSFQCIDRSPQSFNQSLERRLVPATERLRLEEENPSGDTVLWRAMLASCGLSAQQILHQTEHCSACNERRLVEHLVDLSTKRAPEKPVSTAQVSYFSGAREEDAFTMQQQSREEEQHEFDLEDWRPQLLMMRSSTVLRSSTKLPTKRSLVPRAYTAANRRQSEAAAGAGGEEQWTFRQSFGVLRLRERYPYLSAECADPQPVSDSLNRVNVGVGMGVGVCGIGIELKGRSLDPPASTTTGSGPYDCSSKSCAHCLLSRRSQLKLRLVSTLGAVPGNIQQRDSSMPPTFSGSPSVEEPNRNPNHSANSQNDLSVRERSGSGTINFCAEMRRKLCMCLQREATETGTGQLVDGVGKVFGGDNQRSMLAISVDDLLRSGAPSDQTRRSLEAANIKQSLSAVFPYRVPTCTTRAIATTTSGGTRAQSVREPLTLQLQPSNVNVNVNGKHANETKNSEFDQLRQSDSFSQVSTTLNHEVTFAPPPTPDASPSSNPRTPGNSNRVAMQRYRTRERSILRVRGLFPRAIDSAYYIPRHTNSNPPPSNGSSIRSTPACATGVPRDSARLTPLNGQQRYLQNGLRAHTAAAFPATAQSAKGVWDWRIQQPQHEHQFQPPSNPQCPCPQCNSFDNTSKTGARGLLPVAFGSQDSREIGSVVRAVAEESGRERYVGRHTNHSNGIRGGGIGGGGGGAGRLPLTKSQPQLVLEGISPLLK